MTVMSDYFEALARCDVDAMAALWVPDGVDHIGGQVDAAGPNSVCFYVIDPETSRKVLPGPPPDAFNGDTEQARASIRKLVALDPSAAWPGHAEALTGDVHAQLERAASA
jgi:hypothetical protein